MRVMWTDFKRFIPDFFVLVLFFVNSPPAVLTDYPERVTPDQFRIGGSLNAPIEEFDPLRQFRCLTSRYSYQFFVDSSILGL